MKSSSKAKLAQPSKDPIQPEKKEQEEEEIPQSGYDRFEFKSGAIYTGNWKLSNGKKLKHGFGKLLFGGSLGSKEQFGRQEYEGDWFEDKMNGYGTYKYSSGAIYKGQWVHGQQHGQGQYLFADGAKYYGEWNQHLMHGEGLFVDRQGMQWKGIFVNGSYETKDQKALRTERQVKVKCAVVQKKAISFFQKFAEAFAKSDKKTFAANLTPLFATFDAVSALVGDPYSKFEERPPDKWNEALKSFTTEDQTLKFADNITVRALTNSNAAELIEPQRIKADQLTGSSNLSDPVNTGQIVEIQKRDEGGNVKAGLVLVAMPENSWLLVQYKENA